jgi:hypothetical protein
MVLLHEGVFGGDGVEIQHRRADIKQSIGTLSEDFNTRQWLQQRESPKKVQDQLQSTSP